MDRMGCKEGDAMVRSIADFQVPDVIVCLPSFKMFRCFFMNSKTLTPLTSFSRLPHISLKLLNITGLGNWWNRVDNVYSCVISGCYCL